MGSINRPYDGAYEQGTRDMCFSEVENLWVVTTGGINGLILHEPNRPLASSHLLIYANKLD
jgi:hypothetical protein